MSSERSWNGERVLEGDAYLRYFVCVIKSYLGRGDVEILCNTYLVYQIGNGEGKGERRGKAGEEGSGSEVRTSRVSEISKGIHECWNSTLTSLIKSLRHETKRE